MPDDEKEIEALEAQFPMVSAFAFAVARQKVLASGQSVLQAVNGVIYEILPDGRAVALKPVVRPVPITPGLIFVSDDRSFPPRTLRQHRNLNRNTVLEPVQVLKPVSENPEVAGWLQLRDHRRAI